MNPSATTLMEAATTLGCAANPFTTVEVRRPATAALPTIGIGADAPLADLYIGGQGWTATTSTEPQSVGSSSSSIIGGGIAATVAAGWALRTSLGMPVAPPISLSLWTLHEARGASGPAEPGPLDIGTVALIGAGAVASGLIWWLRAVGMSSVVFVIDGDFVEIGNLNRSLALFVDDTGYPVGPPLPKALRGKTAAWSGSGDRLVGPGQRSCAVCPRRGYPGRQRTRGPRRGRRLGPPDRRARHHQQVLDGRAPPTPPPHG